MTARRSIFRKLETAIRMDSARRLLMVEAIMCMALAQLSLRIFSFRTVAARLGPLAPASEPPAPAVVARPEQRKLAKDIGWAITRAARYAPFRAVCLQQAIAAKMMLRRRGVPSAMHFGVAKGANPGKTLHAHAWLDAAQTQVTGYPVSEEFVEVARFL